MLALGLALGGCASTARPYKFRFVPGETAVIDGTKAYPPKHAPPQVLRAIEAANRISGRPYKWGGGHRHWEDSGYDCSGATGYVLHEAGLLESSMPSTGFRKYGEPGEGRWISIYARTDHTFLAIAGLRFDTGWGQTRGRGPRWSDEARPVGGAVVRHPRGF
jgi:hypothetical protein